MTLKRSAALDGQHPDYIKLLETLNIFAVRANYMAQFRDYLEREGVERDGVLDLPLSIVPNRNFLNKGLVIPRVNDGRDFAAETEVLLAPNPDVRRVLVDVSAKVRQFGRRTLPKWPVPHPADERRIPRESFALVDWGGCLSRLARIQGATRMGQSDHLPG